LLEAGRGRLPATIGGRLDDDDDDDDDELVLTPLPLPAVDDEDGI
jgi:hypothetical protein